MSSEAERPEEPEGNNLSEKDKQQLEDVLYATMKYFEMLKGLSIQSVSLEKDEFFRLQAVKVEIDYEHSKIAEESNYEDAFKHYNGGRVEVEGKQENGSDTAKPSED